MSNEPRSVFVKSLARCQLWSLVYFYFTPSLLNLHAWSLPQKIYKPKNSYLFHFNKNKHTYLLSSPSPLTGDHHRRNFRPPETFSDHPFLLYQLVDRDTLVPFVPLTPLYSLRTHPTRHHRPLSPSPRPPPPSPSSFLVGKTLYAPIFY